MENEEMDLKLIALKLAIENEPNKTKIINHYQEAIMELESRMYEIDAEIDDEEE